MTARVHFADLPVASQGLLLNAFWEDMPATFKAQKPIAPQMLVVIEGLLDTGWIQVAHEEENMIIYGPLAFSRPQVLKELGVDTVEEGLQKLKGLMPDELKPDPANLTMGSVPKECPTCTTKKD